MHDKFLNLKECCRNCAYFYKLKQSNYSNGGCTHKAMDGFICMAFADEGIAEWMVGTSENGMCECFSERKDKRGNI